MSDQNQSPQSKIIAYLLKAGRGVRLEDIAKATNLSPDGIKQILGQIAESSDSDMPYRLVTGDNSYVLLSRDHELNQDDAAVEEKLSQALLQSLLIVGYCGPIGKTAVDAVRGVNSRHTLTTLRQFDYIAESASEGGFAITAEGLAFLNVSKQSDLPDFEHNRSALKEGIETRSAFDI